MSTAPILVKICGLSTPETLEASLAAGADLIGLVHFPKSPRHVDLTLGAALSRQAMQAQRQQAESQQQETMRIGARSL